MQATVNFRRFYAAAQGAAKVAKAGEAVVRLTVKRNILTTHAASGEIGFRVDSPASSTTPAKAGSVLVAGGDLVEALGHLKPRVANGQLEVTLAMTPQGLAVTIGDRSKTVKATKAGKTAPAAPEVGPADVPVVNGRARDFLGLVWAVAVGAGEDPTKPALWPVRFHRDARSILRIAATDNHRIHSGLFGEIEELPVDLTLRQVDVETAINLVRGVETAEDVTLIMLSREGGAVWVVGGTTVTIAASPVDGIPMATLDKYLETAVSQDRVAFGVSRADLQALAIEAEGKVQGTQTGVVVTIDPAARVLAMATEVGAKDAKGEKVPSWSGSQTIFPGAALKARATWRIHPSFLADALAGVMEDEATLAYGDPEGSLLLTGSDFTSLMMMIKVKVEAKPARTRKAAKPAEVKAEAKPAARAPRKAVKAAQPAEAPAEVTPEVVAKVTARLARAGKPRPAAVEVPAEVPAEAAPVEAAAAEPVAV